MPLAHDVLDCSIQCDTPFHAWASPACDFCCVSTGMPADAMYLLGMAYPSSECQHAQTLQTLSSTFEVCADKASATGTWSVNIKCSGKQDSKH